MAHIATQDEASFEIFKGEEILRFVRFPDGSMSILLAAPDGAFVLTNSQVAALTDWMRRLNKSAGLVGG